MKFTIKQSVLLCIYAVAVLQCSTAPASESQDDKYMSLSIKQIVEKFYPEGNVFVGMANHAKEIGELSTEIADREFSYITPSNDFKQSYIHRDLKKNNWRGKKWRKRKTINCILTQRPWPGS